MHDDSLVPNVRNMTKWSSCMEIRTKRIFLRKKKLCERRKRCSPKQKWKKCEGKKIIDRLSSSSLSFCLSFVILCAHSIPAPHVVAARAYHMANSPSPSGSQSNASLAAPSNASMTQEKTPLYRLAKLLNQSIKTSEQNIVVKDDAPRRLSWER